MSSPLLCSLGETNLNFGEIFEGTARLHDEFIKQPVLQIFLQNQSAAVLGDVEIATVERN